MDLIQNFEDTTVEHRSDGVAAMKQKYNSLLAQMTEAENSNSSFDCNICFDSALDPVVTLCGHLYCWECIFKWLHVQSSSEAVQQQPWPVCKADISQATLIPLYCDGPSQPDSGVSKPHCDVIPPRPTLCGLHTLFTAENLHANPRICSIPFPSQSSFPDSSLSSSNHVSTTIAAIINPTIGLLGELVDARMFGSTDTNLFSNPVPSSYAILGHNNPRIRRHELLLDKSLNRVSIFLLCYCLLCLLLFLNSVVCTVVRIVNYETYIVEI